MEKRSERRRGMGKGSRYEMEKRTGSWRRMRRRGGGREGVKSV